MLALLLIDANRSFAEDRLVDAIWGEDAPDGARHALQTYISELRRLLDDEIRREGRGYRLVVDPDTVDVHRFDSLVEAARARFADAPAGAAVLLREALALWHGEPYADLADAPAMLPEIARLQEARLGAVEDRVRADLDCGRHTQLVVELEALTREHPYRERLCELHMLALYRSGRQADALRVYERTREILAEELGIDPSPELQSLHRRILAQDSDLIPTPISAESPSPETADETSRAEEAQAGFHVVRGFELRERAGEGDFGIVYRAYQASVGREVAVKVIRPEYSNVPAFVRGFEPRTHRIAELDHANVLPLLDSWRDPNGAYLVTPWVRAGSVVRALRHGPWSLPATLRMLEQVGGALVSAHRHGVVHGDVKASNVLLDDEGNALLTDFAVATRAVDASGAPKTAAAASISPEERRGQPQSPASDVYALGVLAVETLSGTPPHLENPASRLQAVRPDLPPALSAVLVRATEQDPRERQDRVEDLLRELRQAAGADVVAMPESEERAGPIRNPYKGLQPFREADALDFFGREGLVDRLIEAVREHQLVAVVGPSGVGKSSVVRAGLIPSLRARAIPGSRNWLFTEMFPGSYPFEELEAALLRIALDRPEGLLPDLLADDRGMLRVIRQILPADESQLVLVIDQFEEIFSLTADPDIRQLFLDGLVALAGDARSRVRTLVTLRADFFDRPLEHHAFGRLVEAGLVPVTVPSATELAQAVSQPARGVGVEFEPGLVGAIIRDVADQPGGLPLLQHALTELFARREGWKLTPEAYRATGGVLGALGRRAEELYRSLPPDGRQVAQQVFLRLVSVEDHTEDARRRVRRSELAALEADPKAIDMVIRQFGAHRLLSFDHDPVTRGPTVEVAHEALFREWPTLRGWIESRREDLLLHRRLAAAVAEWRQAERPDDYLLGGGRLEEFDRWATETELALTDEERMYLAQSRAREDRMSARRRRRRRGLLGGSIAASIVAVALAAFAFVQRNDATRQGIAARTRATEAMAQQLGARALTEADLDRSLLLAVEGEALSPSHETYSNLLASVLRAPAAIAVMRGWDSTRILGIDDLAEPGTEVVANRAACVEMSPDGKTLVAGDNVGGFVLLDPTTFERGKEIALPLVGCGLGTFSIDGSAFVTLAWADRELHLGHVDIGSGKARTESLELLRSGLRQAGPLVFSPDGRTLLLLETKIGLFPDGSWPEIVLARLDPRTGRPVGRRVPIGLEAPEAWLAFDPGGRQIIVSATDNSWPDPGPGRTAILEWPSMQTVRTFGTGYNVAALSPDGETLALAEVPSTGQTTLLDLRSGTRRLAAGRHAGAVTGVGFSPDGATLVTTGDDHAVLVWDVASGGLRERFEGHAGASFGPAFTPDGRTMFTVGLDESVIAWDLAEDRRLGRPFTWSAPDEPEHRGEFVGAAQAADASVIFRGTNDGRVVSVEVPTGRRRWETTVWTEERIRRLQEEEAEAGYYPVELIAEIVNGFVQSVALSPNSDLLAVAAHHGEVALLDPTDGRVIRRWQANTLGTGWVGQVAFSRDGRILVTANDDGRAVLWDPASGEEIGSVVLPREDPRFVLAAIPSPDGREVAILSSPNVFSQDPEEAQGGPRIGIWDVDTGRPRWEKDANDVNFWARPVLAASPDWSLVATGGFPREVRLWDVKSGRQVGKPLAVSAGLVVSVEFDQRGRSLVTGGTDGAARLFDVASRRQIGTALPGPEGRWTTALRPGR